ncbi:unnamed protein product, partial [Mesorhabditis spiculigera]
MGAPSDSSEDNSGDDDEETSLLSPTPTGWDKQTISRLLEAKSTTLIMTQAPLEALFWGQFQPSRRPTREPTAAERQIICDAVIDYFLASGRPYAAVDDDDFRELIAKVAAASGHLDQEMVAKRLMRRKSLLRHLTIKFDQLFHKIETRVSDEIRRGNGSILIDGVDLHGDKFLGIMFAYPAEQNGRLAPKLLPVGFEAVSGETATQTDELTCYLEAKVNQIPDIGSYWLDHRQDFPRLSHLAKRMLCALSNEAAVERYFSLNRDIDLVTRSLPEAHDGKLEELCFNFGIRRFTDALSAWTADGIFSTPGHYYKLREPRRPAHYLSFQGDFSPGKTKAAIAWYENGRRTLRDIKGLTYQFYPDDDVTPKDVGPLIKHWLRKNFCPEGYEPAIFPGRQPYRKMKGATGEGNRTFPDTNFLELEPGT